MDFEQQLAALNEWHFFSEFTYSKTKFRPQPRSEVEFGNDAPHRIGSLLVIFSNEVNGAADNHDWPG